MEQEASTAECRTTTGPVRLNAPPMRPQHQPSRPNILIADDSRTFLTCLSITLNRMGHWVVSTDLDEAALQVARALGPTLVMLSGSPRGLDTLQSFQRDAALSSIPVVLSSHDPEKTRVDPRAHAAAEILTRPIDLEQLHAAVHRTLHSEPARRRRMLRAAFHGEVTLRWNGRTEPAQAINLSEGGIFLARTPPLPVGSAVEVAFSIGKGGATVEAEGVVLHTRELQADIFRRPAGMAVLFTELYAVVARQLRAGIIGLLIGDLLESRQPAFAAAIAAPS